MKPAVCSDGWQSLRADPLPWLLDHPSPGLRWRLLHDLLDRPMDAPAVVRARGGANAVDPVASALAELLPDGSWANDVGLWMSFSGNAWRLEAAAQLGADPTDPRLLAAAARVLECCPGDGGFALDSGEVPLPCTSARLVHSMALLGLGRDLRVEEALAWLEECHWRAARGWTCPDPDHHGSDESCSVTAAAVLGATIAGANANRKALREHAEDAVVEVLKDTEARARERQLGHPNLMRTDIAELLDSLARARAPYRSSLRPALEILQDRQTSDGRWSFDVGAPASLPMGSAEGHGSGSESPWVTMRAVKALTTYAVEAGLPRLFPERPQPASL